MKKRYILMAVTAALVFAVAAGGTLAATTVQSDDDPVQAVLKTPELGIDLEGGVSAELQLAGDDDVIMPGTTYYREKGDFDDFTVTNTADVDAIVRLTITKYWKTTNDKGEEVLLPAENVKLNFADGYKANWLDGTRATDLFAKGNADSGTTPDTLVFYYRTPLAAKYNDGIKDIVEHTEALLDSLKVDMDMTDDTYQGAQLVIRATADGVQFADGHDDVNMAAINAAWGVNAHIENGILTEIS